MKNKKIIKKNKLSDNKILSSKIIRNNIKNGERIKNK